MSSPTWTGISSPDDLCRVQARPNPGPRRDAASPKAVVHELQGKGRVVYQVRKGSHSLGLVDEDPGAAQPRLLREMPTVKDLQERAMQLKQDSRGNRIVVLRPRLEEWIVSAARDAGVRLGDYSLPNDPLELHKVINVNLAKFGVLVGDLINSPRLRALAGLLRG